jgi:hypothetical protein
MFDWFCTCATPERIELTREQMDNYPNLFMMNERYSKVFYTDIGSDKIYIKLTNNMIFTTSVDNMLDYAKQNYNYPFIFQLEPYSICFYKVINAYKG